MRTWSLDNWHAWLSFTRNCHGDWANPLSRGVPKYRCIYVKKETVQGPYWVICYAQFNAKKKQKPHMKIEMMLHDSYAWMGDYHHPNYKRDANKRSCSGPIFLVGLGVQIINERTFNLPMPNAPPEERRLLNPLNGCAVSGYKIEKKEKCRAGQCMFTRRRHGFDHVCLMFLPYTLVSPQCTGNMQVCQVNRCEQLFASQGGWKGAAWLADYSACRPQAEETIYSFCPQV